MLKGAIYFYFVCAVHLFY